MVKDESNGGSKPLFSGREPLFSQKDLLRLAGPLLIEQFLAVAVGMADTMMVSRCGEAELCFPGGCELGPRPIDLHIGALRKLGVEIEESGGCLHCRAPQGIQGTYISLSFPSVGATENAMLAACGRDGITTIVGAAREPEIVELQNFLNSIGGDIRGAGTSTIYIKGGMEKVPAAAHRIMPDRIAAGTLMCAVAMAGGEAELTDVCPEHIGSLISKLREAGCHISCGRDTLEIRAKGRPREIKLIETLPYPGFPTDMQAQIFALCTVADGTSVIVENLFENRFRHCAELIKMGANITQKDRTAIVRGVEKLSGAVVYAKDLRGGAALTIAGLGAEGMTAVENTEYIDRGYQRLDETLNSLGACIKREDGTQ